MTATARSAGAGLAGSSATRWRARLTRGVLAVPLVAWMAVLVVVPLGLVLLYSFFQVRGGVIVQDPTLSNYRDIASDSLYARVIWRTVLNALLVGASAVVLAYPLAYLVVHRGARFKTQLLVLVLAPLWVSYLMRIFAWQTLLGSDGVINTLLQDVGLTGKPLGFLLYSRFSVWIALLHIALPFTFVPIYVALDRVPASLVAAARDLGAGPAAAFWRVTFPLTLPGVAVGFALAFIEAFGDYVTPTLLGGANGILIGRTIVSQFGVAYNWPLGSALAFVVLVVALLVLGGIIKLGGREAVIE